MRLATALLAFVPAVAGALMADLPQSICNLPPASGGMDSHLAARLVTHAQGGVLADPLCPGRTLVIKDVSPIHRFLNLVDPDGTRFGPAGSGTHVDVELHGQVDGERVFAISQVRAYARHDVLDRRWRVNNIEEWVVTSGWQADPQFPFTRDSRTLKSPMNQTVVHGKLADADVNALLKLSRAEGGTLCQVSESAQSLVRLQCSWPMQARDLRVWVYARDGDSWRLVQKTEAVTN